MRFAFSTLGCPGWSAERVAQQAAELGFEGVEYRLIDGRPIDPVADRARLAGAVAMCRDHGVEVFSLASDCRFRETTDTGHRAELDALHRWVEAAAELQVGTVRVFPFVPDELDEDGADAWLAESVAACVPAAEAAGVVIGLETHDPRYASGRRLARIVERAGSAAVAIVWDAQHTWFGGESTAETMAAVAGRLAYIQVKDARRLPDGEEWTPVLMGEGDVPVAEQVAAIARSGYAGFVSLEWEKFWHPAIEDPEVTFPHYLARLRSAQP